VLEKLASYGLAYVHIIEGATGGPRDFQQGPQPFDYARLKQVYRDAGGEAAWMVNNGYDRELAEQEIESGRADVVAFGKPFISNPDLVRRLKDNSPLNELDQQHMYGGGAKGYTDYPILA
jgi:N-ethylmaleimide reductase